MVDTPLREMGDDVKNEIIRDLGEKEDPLKNGVKEKKGGDEEKEEEVEEGEA